MVVKMPEFRTNSEIEEEQADYLLFDDDDIRRKNKRNMIRSCWVSSEHLKEILVHECIHKKHRGCKMRKNQFRRKLRKAVLWNRAKNLKNTRELPMNNKNSSLS
jgi:spore coat polysaccharide biosynthesis predicted glycosyltransferase SpsG